MHVHVTSKLHHFLPNYFAKVPDQFTVPLLAHTKQNKNNLLLLLIFANLLLSYSFVVLENVDINPLINNILILVMAFSISQKYVKFYRIKILLLFFYLLLRKPFNLIVSHKGGSALSSDRLLIG